jgi:hypothetical protein
MADILLESSQKGKREDLSDLIATADRKNTPFYNSARKGAVPQNVVFQWQMDKYNDPVADTSKTAASGGSVMQGTSSTIDGTDASTTGGFADSATRVLAQNYVHTFDKTVGIGFLAEDVSNIAGAPSELARSVARRIVEMKREIEKHMLSRSNAVTQITGSGENATGYKTKALGSYIHESGKAGETSGDMGGADAFPVSTDPDFTLTASNDTATVAPIWTGAATTITEEVVQNVLQGMYDNTGSVREYTGLVGTTLKRKFTNLASTNTVESTIVAAEDAAPGIAADRTRVVSKDQGSKSYVSSIDIFEGDFGTITLVPDHYVDNAANGYIIPFDEVEMAVHTAPNISELTNNGGGERRLLRAIMGLKVYNPLAFGRFRCA